MGCRLTCCLEKFAWIPLIHYLKIARSTRRDLHSRFELEAVNAHNEIRQCHGVSSLTLNKRLSKTCKAHAQWLASNDLFEHSRNDERLFQQGYCGENLGEMITWHEDYKIPDGRELTFAWFAESDKYEYGNEFVPDAAQFTQLIWKETKGMGIAYAEYEMPDSPGYIKTIIVAQYYPGGNKEGRFSSNVPKPIVGLKNNSKLSKQIQKYQRRKMKLQEDLIK